MKSYVIRTLTTALMLCSLAGCAPSPSAEDMSYWYLDASGARVELRFTVLEEHIDGALRSYDVITPDGESRVVRVHDDASAVRRSVHDAHGALLAALVDDGGGLRACADLACNERFTFDFAADAAARSERALLVLPLGSIESRPAASTSDVGAQAEALRARSFDDLIPNNCYALGGYDDAECAAATFSCIGANGVIASCFSEVCESGSLISTSTTCIQY